MILLLLIKGSWSLQTKSRCIETWDLPIDTNITREQRITEARVKFSNCARTWLDRGVDLSQYNSEAHVFDILMVLDSLNVETFKVYGFSFGTHIAQALLKHAEDRIQHALFAGMIGTPHALRLPSQHDFILKRLQDEINQNPELRAAYGDIMQDARNARLRLKQEPKKFSNGILDEYTFQRYAVAALNNREKLRSLPRLFRAIAKNSDLDWLTKYSSKLLKRKKRNRKGPLSARSQAQHHVMICMSLASSSRLKRIMTEHNSSVFGHILHDVLPDACPALARQAFTRCVQKHRRKLCAGSCRKRDT